MDASEPTYVNRELSWLEFNQRVLDEAWDDSVPLLDRLKFLAITDSNLDEFFMVRVGGLHMLTWENVTRRDPCGFTPEQQLAMISQRVHRMAAEQYLLLNGELEPKLAAEGIHRINGSTLTTEQNHYLSRLFDQELSAIITPMAVGRGRRFPILRDLDLNIAVRLHPNDMIRGQHFAIIPLGNVMDRFITLPAQEGYHYILLEDVIKQFVDRLFPDERVAECVSFRISRNAGMMIDEDGASDLLAEMEEILQARKYSECIRLQIESGITRTLLRFLKRGLKIGDDDVYEVDGPTDLSAFMRLAGMEGFSHLRYEPWQPQQSPAVDPSVSMFSILRDRNVLLSHPYQSFEPVVRLVQEAATDPDVLAIKQTLYRTSRNSAVIDALQEAARQGKYVTVLVELKARFDEARNIEWARQLEREGVQVLYGVKGLKTHSKILMIVRKEHRGLRRYLHFGTGNYNETTAKLYCDISYMTCDEILGRDASAFFNAVAGFSMPQQFLKLAVAPLGLRERILELVRSETERKRHGQKARILAKMNSLVDTEVIDALYEASQAGVEISLNVRGICCLRPGVPGLSENITVLSVIDRFLEHSRIFYFHHGGDEQLFMSSADWMPRNLNRRVELLVPVDDPEARTQLTHVLEATFEDTVKGRRLTEDGTYEKPPETEASGGMRSQRFFYEQACEAIRQDNRRKLTVFEPYRPAAAD